MSNGKNIFAVVGVIATIALGIYLITLPFKAFRELESENRELRMENEQLRDSVETYKAASAEETQQQQYVLQQYQ